MGLENYSVGDYQTMSVSEKIEFMHKVHREEISLWDDDGNENEIWNDFHAVKDELWEQAEMLDSEDILQMMRMFDDDCFELSWQLNLAKMAARNCIHNGKGRIAFYLQHLQEIPSNGRFHGCHFVIKWFVEDDFLTFKEAVQEQSPEIKKLILQILDDIEDHQAEKEELGRLCSEGELL